VDVYRIFGLVLDQFRQNCRRMPVHHTEGESRVNDPVTPMPVDAYEAFSAKHKETLDDLAHRIEDLCHKFEVEFDDPISANEVSVVAAAHITSAAIANSHRREVPMSVSKVVYSIAAAVKSEGFVKNGKLTYPLDDCVLAIIPMEPPEAGEPILSESMMATLPEWFQERLNTIKNSSNGSSK
jgi:hypothetical protein